MQHEELEKQLLVVVEKILGPDGVMVCSNPYYRFNAQQLAYSRQVAYGLCRYRDTDNAAAVNMQQAATGTGKSLGYLVPAFAYAALTGERVMVSTFTRALQQQLLEKDCPSAREWVEQVLGLKVSFARRVGRQNYLSLTACKELESQLRQEEKPNEEALTFIGNLIEWIGKNTHRTPVIDDYLLEVGDDGIACLPSGIERSAITINPLSPGDEIEKYQADIEKTHATDVLIVNHALVMLDASRWAKVLDGDSRKTKVLICDEADRLTAAAESVLSADVSLHRLATLAGHISSAFNMPAVKEAVQSLADRVTSTESHDRLIATMPAELIAQLAGTVSVLRPYAEQFSERLSSPQATLEDVDRQLLAGFCDSFNDLARVSQASKSSTDLAIISWSPVRHFPSLRIGSPEPARIIKRLLAPIDWDNAGDGEVHPPRSYLRAALFTSATLAVEGRSLPAAFDSFSTKIGVIRHCRPDSDEPIHNVTADLFRMFDAPFGFGQMRFVLADSRAPLPFGDKHDEDETGEEKPAVTSSGWLDYCASMIRAAYTMPARVQKTLVLTNSYDDTAALGERLADLEGLILAERGTSLASLKAQYIAADKALLIGPNCWEGFDAPGMVSNLVITRLPYGTLAGARLQLHEASLRQRGYSEDKILRIKHAMLSEEGRQRFTQGLGRGIRRHDDDVRVWIADPRFPLPEEFANSLDPILMVPRKRQSLGFAACIPKRFADAYRHARIFTLDGDVHTPELI
ncbi:ATP-dependent DNA helicase [Stutzerimonas stutzeri]|uniref:ATP-dependent DNA helicase n=1 Tax=Stutzerimonas stutzeri TaxID=316 RepID=UPI00265CA59F|nr:helicase C-terminal domain-containing protein [Stutzerimonas stutzeri]MCF6783734.1 hypothetical protein [Stutzerimonas stutzeri]